LEVGGLWEGQAGNVFGGFLLAVLIRAAGLETSAARPLSVACHYLKPTVVGEPLDVTVQSLRRGRTNELLRVSIGQAGKPTVEALVRAADGGSGPGFAPTRRPALDDPLSRPLMADLLREHGREPSRNFEIMELRHRGPGKAPEGDDDFWCRLGPGVIYDDPFLEAARFVLGMDNQGVAVMNRFDRFWRPELEQTLEWGFANVDSLVHFHQAVGTEWLYTLTRVVTGRDGFVSAETELWSTGGDLLATAMSQIGFFPLREGWAFLPSGS
jgi:acyl-CoA thioesterase